MEGHGQLPNFVKIHLIDSEMKPEAR